ncbi:NEDD8-activating enzyme E1 regulatory subunit [Coemansia sp. RSA 1804]|nr:NEDD8-activating enzyme E1 regulatory subunit [Coemansia sp. RSA 1804]
MRSETDKTQLYDRQLRLWKKTGQTALENSCVCVLGSSALASEALKNLVLPGIGAIVVIDDARVDEQDIKTNFFVRSDDTGKPRASCIVENLRELNPEVRGSAIVASPADALVYHGSDKSEAAAALDSAALVVCCNQTDALVSQISHKCMEAEKALIVAKSAGFMSYIRTSVPEHTVIESHVDEKPDLRLMCPFSSLRDHVDSIDLGALDQTDVAHVPYIVLIIKALQTFAASKDGGNDNADSSSDRWTNYPARLALKEKKELRHVIGKLVEVKSDEENFEEAVKNVNPYCVPYEIPHEIKQILDDPAAATVELRTAATEDGSNLTQQANHRFWLLANALRRYMASDYAEEKLPLSGTIPDMKADTRGYIALQTVYKSKAEQDKSEFVKHLAGVLEEAGLPGNHFEQEEIDDFCKNASKLRLRRMSAIHDEYAKGPEAPSSDLEMNGILNHYVLFRASSEFFAKHGRYPGAPTLNSADKESLTVSNINKLVESDAIELSSIARELLAKWAGDASEGDSNAAAAVPVELATEFARSGFSELHNIASFSGGVIAQEAIKLITHQYVPGNNTFIFDGIKGVLLAAKI